MILRVFFLTLVAVTCAKKSVPRELSEECTDKNAKVHADCRTVTNKVEKFTCHKKTKSGCDWEGQCKNERSNTVKYVKKCIEKSLKNNEWAWDYQDAASDDMARFAVYNARTFLYDMKNAYRDQLRNLLDEILFFAPHAYAKVIYDYRERSKSGEKGEKGFCFPNPWCEGAKPGKDGIKEGITPSLMTDLLQTACSGSYDGNPERSTGFTFSDAQREAVKDILADPCAIENITLVFFQSEIFKDIRDSDQYCKLANCIHIDNRDAYEKKMKAVCKKSQKGATNCDAGKGCACSGKSKDKKVKMECLTPQMALKHAKAVTCDMRKIFVEQVNSKLNDPVGWCNLCPPFGSGTSHVSSHFQISVGHGAPHQGVGKSKGAPTSGFNSGGARSCPGASQNYRSAPMQFRRSRQGAPRHHVVRSSHYHSVIVH